MPERRYLVMTLSALAVACASVQYGATEENLTRAKSKAPRGAGAFHSQCAGCHGERGESTTGAPRVLGEGALPELPRARNVNADPAAGDRESLRLEARSRPAGAPWRDPFRTAKDLHKYVSENMPPADKKRETISAEDYWAIVNFMLTAHGVALPPEGVTEQNASAVKL